MTDERQNDEFVSASYREVAKETTPSNLDEIVLRMAVNAAQRPQYSRFISWTRPLAWAATIALCLAITLEVTRVPVPDEAFSQSMPKQKLDKEADAFDDEIPAAATSLAPQKLEQAKIQPAAAPASRDQEMLDDGLRKRAVEEPRREGRGRSLAPLTFEVKDANVLQHVEELERLQSGTNNEQGPEEVVVSSSATADIAFAADIEAPRGCPDNMRTTADIWLECITALKDAGDVTTAEYEEELLIEVFPDFKMP